MASERMARTRGWQYNQEDCKRVEQSMGGTIAGAWQEHQEDGKAIQRIARTSQVMAIKPRGWHTDGAKITR
jgi:hypothetical protein